MTAAIPVYFDYPQAKILEIHDGDTLIIGLTVVTDYGFGAYGMFTHPPYKLRLNGINAPELATQAGKDALAYLVTLIKVGDVVDVKTIKVHGAFGDLDKQEKFGRYLAVVYVPGNPVSVNQQMIASGHAVPFMV